MKTEPLVPATGEHTEAQRRALDAVVALVNQPTPEEDADLRSSLERCGQLVPILRQGGTVVDGRRRLAALESLGKEPWFVDIDHVDGLEPANDPSFSQGRSFIETNTVRRHTPVVVRAAMADALATFKKGDNQHAGSGTSREDAARRMGLSADTVDRFRYIKNDNAVLTRALSGAITLAQAARIVRAKSLAANAKVCTSPDDDIAVSIDRLIQHGAKLGVILADTPVDYGSPKSTSCIAPQNYYPTMGHDALKALRVSEIAASDAVLWYWTPNSLIPQALEVISAWGFRFVTSMVWVKTKGVCTPGAIRPFHETLLVAKRGQGLVPSDKTTPSVYHTPPRPRRHSSKPTWFADELDRLYPDVPKAELFSRSSRPGWMCLGNQVGKVAEPGATHAANDGAVQGAAAAACGG